MTMSAAGQGATRPTCIDPGCVRSVYCRHRCQRHYNRDVRNGTLDLDKAYHDPLPPLRCSAGDCQRNIRNDKNGGNGMCGLHFQRWKKHGDPLYVRPPRQPSTCTYEGGCDKLEIAGGLCHAHYKRKQKHGDPSVVLKPDFSNRPTSRPAGVEQGSRHWSCGHARKCSCPASTGSCSTCGEVLLKSQFGLLSKRDKPYVSTTCKPCLAAKRRRWRVDPQTADREREIRRASYQRTDRALRGLRSRRYRHLRSNLPGSYTEDELVALFQRYDWLCGYCGQRPATDMDHIIPAILHGMEEAQRRLGVGPPTNDIDNFMPACSACNLAKGSRTVDQWRRGEPMVRRGDIEFPPRLYKTLRGPRPDTVQLYERILALLDRGLNGNEVALQLRTHRAYVSAAVKWAGRSPLKRPGRSANRP